MLTKIIKFVIRFPLEIIGATILVIMLSTYNITGNLLVSVLNYNDQSAFDSGIYNETKWDAGNAWVNLTAGGQLAGNGNYTSEIKNVGLSNSFNSISWVPQRPTNKELPGTSVSESGYPTGNANMSGNVGLWHFNEASGIMADSSGQSNNGTQNNGITYNITSKLKTGVSFDGNDDYISVNDSSSLDISSAFTYETWLKFNSAFSSNSQYNQAIMDKGAYQLFLDKSDGKLKFSLDNSAATSWTLSYDSPATYITSLAVYQNKLYAGSDNSAIIYQYDGSSWTQNYDLPSASVQSLAVYKGNLYAGTGAGGIVYAYDGTNWTTSYDSPAVTINSLAVNNNKLYAGSDSSGIIYEFNGTSWIQSYDSPAGTIYALTVYNNKLYAGTSTSGTIYVYDGSSWSLNYDSPETTVNSLAVYDGKLYAGTGTGGKVYSYDGTTWTMVYDSPASTIYSLAVYNGKLYAGTSPDGIIYAFDGTSWSTTYDSTETYIYSLAVYNGKLFMGSRNSGQVYVYGNNEVLSSAKNSWDTNWHHIAVTYNGVTMKTFVDGSLDNSKATAITIDTNNLKLLLGKTYGSQMAGGNSELFAGTMDETAIYNRGLSDTEISDHYKRAILRQNFQVRSCDDALCDTEIFIGPDGNNTSYYSEINNSTATTPTFVLASVPNNKYFQYKTFFENDNNAFSPELKSVSLNYTHINTIPTATVPGTIIQHTDGSGYVSFQTAIADVDSEETKLKIEYSDDGGVNWFKTALISVVPDHGTTDLVNANAYQIGSANGIDTDEFGNISLTVVWDTKSAANGNGTLDLTDQSDIKIRVIPNDNSADGAAQLSANFRVDNLSPSITLTSVSPNSGIIAVGSIVNAILTTGESGLIIGGVCTIDGVDVRTSFIDNHDNTYSLHYTVTEGNSDWRAGALPINCNLKDTFGNIGSSSAFNDGNSLAGDANSIVISSTSIDSPFTSGWAKIGDTIMARLNAGESGLSLTSCSINTVDVSGSFNDNGDGTYSFSYLISGGESDWTAGNLPINCNLIDAGGNLGGTSLFNDLNTLAGDANNPSGLTALAALTPGETDQTLNWSPVTEANFDHYEIWHGTQQADVQSRSGTAEMWDNVEDTSMAIRLTNSTTINGLTPSTIYYYKIWAVDLAGNEETIVDINSKTADTPIVPIPATLHIIKQVTNDNGGTAIPADFNLHVKLSGIDVTGSPAAGTDSPGTLYSLDAGFYEISEDPNAIYEQSFSGDCDLNGNITLTSGDNKICTIINDDIAPPIKVVGGGSAQFGEPSCSGTDCKDFGDNSTTTISPPVQSIPKKPEDNSCDRLEVSLIPFTDISNNWASSYIETLYRQCVIDGKTAKLFEPGKYITRAELVKIALLAFNINTVDFEKLFLDVNKNDWFALFVTTAAKLNIVSRQISSNNSSLPFFNPGQNITRAEAVKILLMAKGITNFGSYETKFSDVTKNDWFFPYVAYVENKGIIKGYTQMVGKSGLVRDNYSLPSILGLSSSSKQVQDLKEILKQLGYYSGPIDKKYNNQLSESMKMYQVEKSLKPNGNLDYKTRKAILAEILVPKQIISFKPNDFITREEASKIVVLVSDSN